MLEGLLGRVWRPAAARWAPASVVPSVGGTAALPCSATGPSSAVGNECGWEGALRASQWGGAPAQRKASQVAVPTAATPGGDRETLPSMMAKQPHNWCGPGVRRHETERGERITTVAQTKAAAPRPTPDARAVARPAASDCLPIACRRQLSANISMSPSRPLSVTCRQGLTWQASKRAAQVGVGCACLPPPSAAGLACTLPLPLCTAGLHPRASSAEICPGRGAGLRLLVHRSRSGRAARAAAVCMLTSPHKRPFRLRQSSITRRSRTDARHAQVRGAVRCGRAHLGGSCAGRARPSRHSLRLPLHVWRGQSRAHGCVRGRRSGRWRSMRRLATCPAHSHATLTNPLGPDAAP